MVTGLESGWDRLLAKPGVPWLLGAALWFRKAAEGGHQGAMTELSRAYLGGHGVVRNAQEAARWAKAARRESTS